MKKGFPLVSTIIVIISALFFLVPLYATFQFSLQALRGQLSFEAYNVVFADPRFLSTVSFSIIASAAAIVLGSIVVVPTAYWVRLKLPKFRPVIEFITLLPLIVPPIVLVFGYIRLYGSNSMLPLLNDDLGTNLLLVIGYVVLSLPYMYRSIDNGLSVIDIATLTEAAEILGASRLRTIWEVIFPNVRSAIVSGAFLTFSISFGEFVLASLLDRDAFGPYLVLIGEDLAYEPAALATMSFALTWGMMILMQLFASRKPGQRLLSRKSPPTAIAPAQKAAA